MSENHALHGAVPECAGRPQRRTTAQINKFQPKEGNTVNNSDVQKTGFTHHESNGVVRIRLSDADKSYIDGSGGKAFKTVLPGFILSFVMIIGAFLANHYLLADEASGGEMSIGSFLFLFAVVVGCIMLLGSVITFPALRYQEKDRRTEEMLSKYVR